MGLQYVPAGDHVPGSEVLEDNPWEWPNVQGVHLHQVPGFLHLIPLGLASGYP